MIMVGRNMTSDYETGKDGTTHWEASTLSWGIGPDWGHWLTLETDWKDWRRFTEHGVLRLRLPCNIIEGNPVLKGSQTRSIICFYICFYISVWHPNEFLLVVWHPLKVIMNHVQVCIRWNNLKLLGACQILSQVCASQLHQSGPYRAEFNSHSAQYWAMFSPLSGCPGWSTISHD